MRTIMDTVAAYFSCSLAFRLTADCASMRHEKGVLLQCPGPQSLGPAICEKWKNIMCCVVQQ